MTSEYLGNEQEFADTVVDNTLDVLRDQRDEKQRAEYTGVFTINPHVFKNTVEGSQPHTHHVQGPIIFEQAFKSTPIVTFGQVSHEISNEPISATLGNTYIPFVVQPYVFRWKLTNAAVDGFWVGLYALTPPLDHVTGHTISWRAIGEATAYKEQGQQEQWTESYNTNEADFLVDDVSQQDTGSDTIGEEYGEDIQEEPPFEEGSFEEGEEY